MTKLKNARETVLKASRAYYTHRAFYEDLLFQRQRRLVEATKRELSFLEHAFGTNATRMVREVLDVACGSGRHVFGLAKRGYKCTGLDYTPERVQIALDRGKREGVSVNLLQGDATRVDYENEFDAVLALYILFLLPNDVDVLKALGCCFRALRKGGVLICNIGNPYALSESWSSLQTIYSGLKVDQEHIPGLGVTEIYRLHDFDPVHGVVWWQETNVIETPEGNHVFRDRERLRLFTYWDILHYLQLTGFTDVDCYPDWKINGHKKPSAQTLVFVSRKD